MSGTQDDMAEGISDKELLSQFKRIDKLPKERKAMVKELLDALLLKEDAIKKPNRLFDWAFVEMRV